MHTSNVFSKHVYKNYLNETMGLILAKSKPCLWKPGFNYLNKININWNKDIKKL